MIKLSLISRLTIYPGIKEEPIKGVLVDEVKFMGTKEELEAWKKTDECKAVLPMLKLNCLWIWVGK